MDKKKENLKIAIIGGGLTGLTAAFKLSQFNYDVHLFESDDRVGGMIKGVALAQSGQYIDDIYHHLFTSDKYLLSLLKELGLDFDLSWQKAKNALLYQQNLYPFSTPFDLLNFKPIPFRQRLRTGLAVLKASRLKNWQKLEKELASDWLSQNCGQKSWSLLWQPLLASKFGPDFEQISAVWIWNKFKLRGSSRDGANEKLGYLKGGFQRLVNKLEETIKNRGVKINTNRHVTRIFTSSGENERAKYKIEDQQEVYPLEFDHVIATVAAEEFLIMAEQLINNDQYKRKLAQVKYKANLCLALVYEKTLSPWYWTTICDDLPFVVAVEQDNLYSAGQEEGSLVYFSRYLDQSDQLWQKTDEEILAVFKKAAAVAFPLAKDNKVISSRLTKTRYSQPVIERNYSKMIPEIKTPAPGLWLAGMAQIYPEDRGMNYAVRLAEETVSLLRGKQDG